MIISLDYDKTYTEDPELWDRFISDSIKSGHSVVCVTMRTREEGADIIKSLGHQIPIYFTARRAKLLFMREQGVVIDVWIDDNPLWLYDDG